MHQLIKKSIFIFSLLFLFWTCSKSPGLGGQATIKGKVTVNNVNVLGNVTDVYSAQEHDVYIIYGDNNTYDDDFKTSYDGSFEFNYLNPGNYEIFTYSECLSCPNGQDSLIKISPTINDKKEVLDLGEIIIINY